ncbi:hypothetical protein [Nostoc sp.]|uniref:hypothetical protein n=1 Tax=Nostoc sp. TaxID=1180 RepID=UPI002FF9566E
MVQQGLGRQIHGAKPLLFNFAAIFTVPQALAQNPDRRKLEADRLIPQRKQRRHSRS